jgi:hypothetical protein
MPKSYNESGLKGRSEGESEGKNDQLRLAPVGGGARRRSQHQVANERNLPRLPFAMSTQ